MKLFKAIAVTAAVAAAACAFAFAGCENNETAVPESLTLNYEEAKVSFEVNDFFSSAGLVVTVNYSDESEKELEADEYTLTPPDLSTAGEKDVTVSYTEGEVTLSASYKITVTAGGSVTPPPAEESLLTLDISAVKQAYNVGEAFSADGLKVTDNSGETPVELTSDQYTLTAPTLDGAGAYTVEVAYNGLTATYTVVVIPEVEERWILQFESLDAAASLTLYITEYNGTFTNGTDSSAKGIYIYRDASGYQAFDFDFSYNAASWASNFNTAGVYETIFHDIWDVRHDALCVDIGDGQRAPESLRFWSSSVKWHPAVLGWTEVATLDRVNVPSDKVFAVGSAFDASGITVEYTMTDGSKGTAVAGVDDVQFFDVATRGQINSAYTFQKVGALGIRVLYSGKVTDIEIEVTAGSARLSVSGGTREYLMGAVPNANGITVTFIDENGATTPVAAGDYQVTLPTAEQMANPGSYKATVTYGEYSISYDILVIPDVNWDIYKLDFGNLSATSDRLELYMNNRAASSDEQTASEASGYLVVKRADGGYEVYAFAISYNPEAEQPFTFTADDGVVCEVNAENGNLEITVGDRKFHSGNGYWQQRVLGW